MIQMPSHQMPSMADGMRIGIFNAVKALSIRAAALIFALLLTLAPALSPGGAIAAGPALDTRRISTPTAGEWPSHGRDYHEQRYSPLDRIHTGNVGQLGLAWSFDIDSARGIEATPLIIDGVMYVTGPWSVVYALDARTGQRLWRYDPQVPRDWGRMACCDVVNRGVAVYEGKVFVGTLDARLVALDAVTGELLWETRTADAERYAYTITGAPRAARGLVFIGNGGAEFGVRGYVGAYDAATGQLRWRFYTVPGNPAEGFEDDTQAEAAKTWNGEWWKYGGGGTVWDSIVYDPELDRLYIGVGNGSPWNAQLRSPGGGDNLFLSSIVALDPMTGRYLWHYQEVPGEMWDYTASQHIMLAEMNIAGRTHKVLWHAPKNGFFFIIDRENGKLLSAEPYSKVTWAKGYDLATGRPILNPDADWARSGKKVTVYPSSAGAHNWQPMAYSPRTGLVYIPEQQFPGIYQSKPLHGRFGSFNLGTDLAAKGVDNPQLMAAIVRKTLKGRLLAWDPIEQQAAWRVPRTTAGSSGLLATGGDLVFQATVDAELVAVHAADGKTLWRFPTQEAGVAPPISYELDGEQYVAVAVGRGGALGLTAPLTDAPLPATGRVLAFKLGGRHTLPPAVVEVSYGDPPSPGTRDKAMLARGEALYRDHCLRCHSAGGAANRRVPDLRRLERPRYDLFDRIVREGLIQPAGMPGFGDTLSKDDTQAIKDYLLDQAERDRAFRSQPAWLRSIKQTFYEAVATIIAWLM